MENKCVIFVRSYGAIIYYVNTLCHMWKWLFENDRGKIDNEMRHYHNKQDAGNCEVINIVVCYKLFGLINLFHGSQLICTTNEVSK